MKRAGWGNNPAALACMKREMILPDPQHGDANRREAAHRDGALKKTAKSKIPIINEQGRNNP